MNRSPFKLIDEIKVLIDENKIDVLSLTETDFDNSKLAQEFQIDGFDTFIQGGKNKIRTILLTKTRLQAEQIKLEVSLPVVTVKIKPENCDPIAVSSIYRQWSGNQMEEICELQDVLTSTRLKRVAIMGDFNIGAGCLLNLNGSQQTTISVKLREICEENGMNVQSCGPTFFYQQGSKCSDLDFFLTRKITAKFSVVLFGNSDHDAIKAEVPIEKHQNSMAKTMTIRSKIRDVEGFKKDMRETMDSAAKCMFQQNDPDTQADIFIRAFQSVMEIHAPLKTIKLRPCKPQHALAEDTLKLRKERNKARNSWHKASTNEKKVKAEIYKRLRNRVNALIKRDRVRKTEYDLKKGVNPFKVAKSLLGDRNKTYKIKLIEDGNAIDKEEDVASVINEYFVTKIRKLKADINPTEKIDPLQKIIKRETKFSFQLVSVEQVQKIIGKMKKSNSSGMDGISAAVMKLVNNEVATALSVLINTSLMEGVFPKQFKTAVVTPIYKNKGSKEDKSNYRPISNLSTAGKVLEIAANIQITRYCERIGVLGSHQHGFRQGRSTTSAVISSLVKWQTAKEEGRYTGCLLYDLSSAYDTISLELLIEKARLYGFDGTAAGWLRSFTTERSQAVKVGDFISSYRELECGIPQGSPISCVLFLIYVQDLPAWVSDGDIQGYADDTMHFVSSNSLQGVLDRLEAAAAKILVYFASNELVANPTKTAFLLFRPTSRIESEYQVKVGGAIIREAVSERVLGIQVKRNLEWDDHVTKVLSKMSHGLATLRQLQGILRRQALQSVSEGIVMSHLRYGMSVYLSGEIRLAPSDPIGSNLKKLQTKQNDAMRLVLNKKRKDLTPREDLLKQCNLKAVNQMAAEAVIMETWRAFSYNIDSIRNSYQRNKCSRCEGLLRTSKEPKSFISKSAKLWNNLSKNFHDLRLTSGQAKVEASKFIAKLPSI